MALYVVASLAVSTSDYDRIQEFRKRNDALYYPAIHPHFPLVFPLSGWEAGSFIAEVEKQSKCFRPFDFCIRCATLDKDSFIEYYHALLVPDEGYGQFVRLHDRLYADKLFPHRALHVDFIPHVGIGNSKDPLRCIEMIESWNREEFVIPGRVAALTIGNYENGVAQPIQCIPLRG